jgi:hypothetical protein
MKKLLEFSDSLYSEIKSCTAADILFQPYQGVLCMVRIYARSGFALRKVDGAVDADRSRAEKSFRISFHTPIRLQKLYTSCSVKSSDKKPTCSVRIAYLNFLPFIRASDCYPKSCLLGQRLEA